MKTTILKFGRLASSKSLFEFPIMEIPVVKKAIVLFGGTLFFSFALFAQVVKTSGTHGQEVKTVATGTSSGPGKGAVVSNTAQSNSDANVSISRKDKGSAAQRNSTSGNAAVGSSTNTSGTATAGNSNNNSSAFRGQNKASLQTNVEMEVNPNRAVQPVVGVGQAAVGTTKSVKAKTQRGVKSTVKKVKQTRPVSTNLSGSVQSSTRVRIR